MHPSPRRATLAVAAVVATVLAVLAGPAPSPAEPPPPTAARVRPADRPWTGFAIPRTGRAASGWIGARRLHGAVVVYRTDPRRRATSRAFVGARTTRSFRAGGGRRVGPSRTACAALLLGRYGVPARSSTPAERRLQAAAVDVAVLHLLFGRGYRYDGLAQRRRTDQRRNGPLIRAYARELLAGCDQAGPYRVRLEAATDRVDVGDRVDLTATVLSRAGLPVAGVTVGVTPGDGSPPYDVVTGSDGTTTVAVTPRSSGPLTPATVTRRLPSTALRVLVPRARGASRVVQAGLKLGDAYPRSVTVVVQGQPTLRLLAVGPVDRNTQFRTTFRLGAAYPGRRTATVQVFGPLASEPVVAGEPDPRCRPRSLVRQRRVVVDAAGTYRTEPLALGKRGTYVWRVVVPGDTYNKPVSLCGGQFRVR
ncbi:Ig-like domain-containing protein [Nocardioides rubriscoriae]|uniref:Ig-like domain-containing protein n=1 Tax=Nocardioides rubriscoriae TaxID=642762 RepID=UPI0011DF45FC|nr:Ig-like domain-containing protein [Nocardioides rubriscoriae]